MEVLKAKSTDWASIQKFLNDQLRSNVPWTIKDEYPVAFSEKNIGNIRFIENDGEVLAHAVVHPLAIKTHYHLFKVGLIGSVVTREDQRGQGLSRPIIENCLQDCTQLGCDIAMLWTDLFDFYNRFGFEVAGSEVALTATPQFESNEKKDLKILNSHRVSPDALIKLFNQHQLRSLRKSTQIRDFLKIPNTELFTAWNKLTNTLEAYCVIGKGNDFTNYIHEWGGQVSSLLNLIEHIVKTKNNTVTLITPPQCQNLIRKMTQCGAQKHEGVLGMITITHPQSFCKKIKKGARSLGHSQFIFEFRDGRYYFGNQDEVYCTDSTQDIVRLVFGPNPPEKIHDFHPSTLEVFKDIFPIPFWVWGWDSI